MFILLCMEYAFPFLNIQDEIQRDFYLHLLYVCLQSNAGGRMRNLIHVNSPN